MKTIVLMTLICVFVTVPASADLISFLSGDGFAGVDGDTSAWSTTDATASLGSSSWSLLSGMASVDAYINGSSGTLSHRGTRGLGVLDTGDADEVDIGVSGVERIEITFPNLDYYVNSLEVRSLFTGEGPGGAPEQGVVDFWRDGSSFYTESLVAVQSGGNGVLAVSYGPPYLVDKLVFHIPTGQSYSSFSELAVAKLDVSPVPVPGAALLAMLGLSAVGVKLRKRT